eukprot:5997327-Ditylum_brightwellii.AAC.1
MELRYRFQENKDNGQKRKYSKSTNTKLCPVIPGLRTRRRVQRLRVKAHISIDVYSSSSEKKAKYISDKDIES